VRLARIFVAAALLAVAAGIVPARAEGPSGVTAATNPRLGGRWAGAKLRCQKDEGKLVRCGTPTPFEITFSDAGDGSTPDESLPAQFTWRWLAPKEIGVTPLAGGEELKLFAVEREEGGALTFQAYVYSPGADPSAPAEAGYTHFVFDVNLAD
jgi:hypothetical protein